MRTPSLIIVFVALAVVFILGFLTGSIFLEMVSSPTGTASGSTLTK